MLDLLGEGLVDLSPILSTSSLPLGDDLAIFRSTGQLFYVTSFSLGWSRDSSQ